jgi:hypothetical protein
MTRSDNPIKVLQIEIDIDKKAVAGKKLVPMLPDPIV